MGMIKHFNKFAERFLDEPVTVKWLENHPEGRLSYLSDICEYKLKVDNGKKMFQL